MTTLLLRRLLSYERNINSKYRKQMRRWICVFSKNLVTIIILIGSICSNSALANESVIPPDNQFMVNQMLTEVFDTAINGVQVRPLKGGFSGDKLFLISYGDKKIVLRIHRKRKSVKDKQLEYQASKNASDLGIGPKVIYVSKEYDLLATEYINAQHPDTKTMMKQKKINYIVDSLLKLHNGPKLPNAWSVFEYTKKIIPKNPNEKEKLAIAELQKIEAALQSKNFQSKPCHNDIQSNNLFITDNKVLFIDWGDAGMSDPFWDLARISMEFAFNSEQDSYLLEKYLGKVTGLDKSRFFIMKQVFLLRSAFWLKNITGSPDKEKLKEIIKIFEVNNYPLNIGENEKVTWNYLHTHAMNLFLKNSKTNLYQRNLSLK